MLYFILGVCVVFTLWSGFAQYYALTHGTAVLLGRYDDSSDPGAINHFQALTAALSGTVGLGNIGGVSLAIALGGPGAMFWMWTVALLGMSVKLASVTLSMLFRNTDDPNNPHGGPMYVVAHGLGRAFPSFAGAGKWLGGLFCIAMLISMTTGGNMFQAWNVGTITESYFGVPSWLCGLILAAIIGFVIIGGISRIGQVTSVLVPGMVAMYLLVAIYVVIVNIKDVPAMLALMFTSAFSPQEAEGAFIGGTMGYAFMIGMKRAIFSNEVGQGSSPIVHAAAKTDEPVREGLVGGLEPFIDTIIVCTLTALVILSTGVWNRAPDNTMVAGDYAFTQTAEGDWQLPPTELDMAPATPDAAVFAIVAAGPSALTGNNLHKLAGAVRVDGDRYFVDWAPLTSSVEPRLTGTATYTTYIGATLTAHAFDTIQPGLGKYLITLATWLFAISTMIAWAYYGEQCVVFMFGEGKVIAFKFLYCAIALIATLGWIRTDADLDNMAGVGTGVMVIVHVPILCLFAAVAMRVYKEYRARLRSGAVANSEPAPSIESLLKTGFNENR
ncbi:MAG: alanine/glycine:cation symporter family protein [Pseudomonadota bacterium]